jgi:hypothetical protein
MHVYGGKCMGHFVGHLGLGDDQHIETQGPAEGEAGSRDAAEVQQEPGMSSDANEKPHLNDIVELYH